jgi:hypothetical protein
MGRSVPEHPVLEDDAAGLEHLGVHQLQGEIPSEVVEHPGSGGENRRMHDDQVLVDQSWRAVIRC